MNRERRHFLKMAGYGLGATALSSMMEQLALSTAWAQPPGTDYKALVCVFLTGGNDGNNMVIPITTPYNKITYTQYANVRNPNGLAIAQSALSGTMIAPTDTNYGTWALHPAFASTTGGNPLYPLWAQNKLAVVANVGPLTRFMTRQEYQDPTVQKPYQLFSHPDQQEIWQTSRADVRLASGWGGRIGDRIPPASPPVPVNVSISGLTIFGVGVGTPPLVLSTSPIPLSGLLALNGFSGAADEQVRKNILLGFTGSDNDNSLIAAANTFTSQSVAISQYLNVTNPTFRTTFPNTILANQLLQVARIIKVVTDQALVRRQVFFCSLGGFDTHSGELGTQMNLLTQVSQAMRAFYDVTVEMGLADLVTTFTMSDFGRTFQPTGSGAGVGADHGWGNHHLVVGGAVRGKNFYGRPRDATIPVTIFPDLELGGASDTDNRGRWIPTVAVEQYAATLANWFGLAPEDMNYVFPNLPLFAPADLGFMTPT